MKLKRIAIIMVLLCVCLAVASDQTWGDFSFMKNQKSQLFGWDYQGKYSKWFGVRGYGFGLELGYVGMVYGIKETFDLTMPDWLVWDETKREKKIDVYLDGFTYVNLSNMTLYPEKIRGWLFWEISFWFGL